jgi:hypothetical protein
MPAIIEPERPPEPDARLPPLGKRLAWFAGLAIASSVVTALFAYALRASLPTH